ncbi:histidine kinase [Streptomyces sp. N2-109]|uniref:histidine kinase n=1 Tax=Streptomyces gossypii TaxID=2883101 RepID=A0ABT2JM89_9ACTN|nr:histidine kinase [Streptomyces gossypii]MCT2588998.1 histidine kinase [Streptomyces gossypii]
MIDPLVTTATLLASGFAGSTAALVVQTRAKRRLRRHHLPREKALTEELAVARERFRALEAETRHLAKVRFPALVDAVARGHRGVEVPGPAAAQELRGTSAAECHETLLRLCEEAVSVSRDGIGLASRAAVRDVIDEAQTFLVRCQMKVLEEMDQFPEGTTYHQSLMNVDHLVTRSLHTLQRTRVLTGSWPGLQRADCTFREIVESARGRIDAYLRVEYIYEPASGEVYVEGRCVEPVTMALTELLSNATAYSDGKVSVEVQQTQTGYCVLVDDSGLSMNVYQREEAARLLSRNDLLDVTNLPDTLHLGFPVIGSLGAEYGFHADVSSTSPYGGVRAVLRIPRELLGQGPTDEEKKAERQSMDGSGLSVGDSAALSADLFPQQQPPTSAGDSPALPQRRRREPKPASPAPVSKDAPPPQEDAEAFQQGFARLAAHISDSENERTTIEGDQLRD